MTGPVATGLRPRILAHLEKHPLLSTPEIARKLGANTTTMDKVLKAMAEEGLLTRELSTASNGRPASLWRVA